MSDLADRFPGYKGFATEDNARRKLAQHQAMLEGLLTAVAHRPSDGRWLPIVVLGQGRLQVNVAALASRGICVTMV